MTEERTIALREHLEALIRQERELREAGATSTERALGIQALEYQRRLEGLNHAHEQMMEAQATFLPRELFDSYRLALESRLSRIERQAAGIAGGLAILMILLRFIPGLGNAQ